MHPNMQQERFLLNCVGVCLTALGVWAVGLFELVCVTDALGANNEAGRAGG